VRLIDLSQPVFDAAPNCPDHPPVSVRRIADHAADGWRMELLTVASHTGSHVDAPLHRLADGQSIDDLPLETWVGGAFIADLRGAEPDRPIGPASLERALAGRELHDAIVLLATGLGDVREDVIGHFPQCRRFGKRDQHAELVNLALKPRANDERLHAIFEEHKRRLLADACDRLTFARVDWRNHAAGVGPCRGDHVKRRRAMAAAIHVGSRQAVGP